MLRFALAMVLALLALPATAQVPLDGSFTATRACPAYQSINKQTNPGNITLEPGQDYPLLAANKQNPTHFQLEIPGASPPSRWVAVDCGSTAALASEPPPPTQNYRGTQYILAVSWQPAFCETKPNVVECRAQTEDSFEATNFALHGLWPEPRDNQFCDVSSRDQRASDDGRWFDLPEVELSNRLRRQLAIAMPGTASALDRHEWTKHGTCYGTSAEEYYADSLALMQALNASAIADLFASNIGRKITLAQIRAAAETSFGPNAGSRLAMTCTRDGNRTIITELTFALTGDVTTPADLAALLTAASPARDDCQSGMVDPVGTR